MIKTLALTVDIQGIRLDVYLAQHSEGLTRSHAQRLIKAGYATVNGIQAKPSTRLEPGDNVVATIPPPESIGLEPEKIPLNMIYEDEDVLVVDKPAGLTVHPAPGHPSHTLVNAILAHCPELAGVGGGVRPGIVHRLDKDTSGLLMVAKNDRSYQNLSRQIKERAISKKYLAMVKGRLTPEQGIIDATIGRDPRNRKRMAVVQRGRQAVTRYRVIKYLANSTLVEVSPETGRTHQIRVHLSSVGHPVIGDSTYGGKSPVLGRQFLHASLLGFRLPQNGEYMEFTSELPQDLAKALESLS